jgi:hypothetical protein
VSDNVRIPKYAGAFAGVEIKDCFILLGGALVGFIFGGFFGFGLKGYVGIPVICYFANASYLDWKEEAAPGYLRAMLFRFGLIGYSRAFPRANMVYVGDSKALNPSSYKLIEQHAASVNSQGGN